MVIVFDFLDYKKYLLEKISSLPSKGRGVRLALSDFLGCQTAYTSQVLNQQVHFSLEQAVRINKFFNHTQEESRFFLLLVQLGRAGSFELEEFLRIEIQEILTQREDIQNRINVKENLDEMNQHIYYSSWHYAAIHVVLSIPGYDNAKSISQYFGMEQSQVQEILDFLTSTGLVNEKEGKYLIGQTRIHLSKKSIQIRRHHTNWRNRAIHSIDENSPKDFHYSSVLTISQKDIKRVKKILNNALDECKEIIRESPEEVVQVFNVDLFQLGSKN